MKKLLTITTLLSFLLLFIQCNRDSDDIGNAGKPLKTLVRTRWHKYFNGNEVSKYTGGYFNEYHISSMSMSIEFEDETHLTIGVDGVVNGRDVYRSFEGKYTYDPSTGRLKMKYNQNVMGIDTDLGEVGEKYLIIYTLDGKSNIKFNKSY